MAIEARSAWKKGQSEKVTEHAVAITEKNGLSADEIETVRSVGLHSVTYRR